MDMRHVVGMAGRRYRDADEDHVRPASRHPFLDCAVDDNSASFAPPGGRSHRRMHTRHRDDQRGSQ
jgi:hypothetical protein